MWRADEMHEGVGRSDLTHPPGGIERIALDDDGTSRQRSGRGLTCERPNRVPARQQRLDERTTQIARPACDEDATLHAANERVDDGLPGQQRKSRERLT